MSTRDLVRNAFAAFQPKAVAVEVPEIGVTVYVRELTTGEIQDQASDTESKDKAILARAIARVICDENGERIYDHTSADDLALIARMPWAPMKAILDRANEVNGQSKKAVEALQGN